MIEGRIREKPPAQLPALTGIRILAAFWVLLFHFAQINVDTDLWFNFGFLNPLIHRGYLGVDIFFVLSGFILTHVYRTRFQRQVSWPAWRDFLQFRIARLYPVHLVTMLLMGAMFIVGARAGFQPHKTAAFTFSSLLANLTLTHAWFPGVAAMNTPAWSISAEWFAYLWFPLVYFALFRLRGRSLLIPVAICAAVPFFVHDWSPITQISVEFILGICVYELHLEFSFAAGLRWGSLLAAGFAIFAIYAVPDFSVPAVMIASAFAFPCLASEKDLLTPLMSSSLLVYGGEISYSLYMFHWVVWSFLRRGLGVFLPHVEIPHVALMIMATLLSFITAALAYHWIELPGRRFLRSKHRESRVDVGRVAVTMH